MKLGVQTVANGVYIVLALCWADAFSVMMTGQGFLYDGSAGGAGPPWAFWRTVLISAIAAFVACLDERWR